VVIDRSQVAKSSRRKGSSFERAICKELSAWYYGDTTILRRVPLSGGWDAAKAGDVMLPPAQAGKFPVFPYFVECRNRQSWSLELPGGRNILLQWLEETAMLAEKSNLIPLLIFTRPHVPIYVSVFSNLLESVQVRSPEAEEFFVCIKNALVLSLDAFFRCYGGGKDPRVVN